MEGHKESKSEYLTSNSLTTVPMPDTHCRETRQVQRAVGTSSSSSPSSTDSCRDLLCDAPNRWMPMLVYVSNLASSINDLRRIGSPL